MRLDEFRLESNWEAKMKISVITDISVLRFYEYIGYIENISIDILTQNIGDVKINKNSENIKKIIKIT